jgi:hypothetical protein
VSVPDILSGEKKLASLFFKAFFVSFSHVGQMRRWSNGDVPCHASVHLSSEFEGEEHASYVVSINSSIKSHSKHDLID